MLRSLQQRMSHKGLGLSSFGTACVTTISNRNEPPVKRQGACPAPVRRRQGKRAAHEKTHASLPRMACPAHTGVRGGTAYRGRHAPRRWRSTGSRRSLQPHSPALLPPLGGRALSISHPPNGKRPPLKPGTGSGSKSDNCKRNGGSLKSNYTEHEPRATATRRSVSAPCWNRTGRRWKSSSPNSDRCHAATLPQRVYPD